MRRVFRKYESGSQFYQKTVRSEPCYKYTDREIELKNRNEL